MVRPGLAFPGSRPAMHHVTMTFRRSPCYWMLPSDLSIRRRESLHGLMCTGQSEQGTSTAETPSVHPVQLPDRIVGRRITVQKQISVLKSIFSRLCRWLSSLWECLQHATFLRIKTDTLGEKT